MREVKDTQRATVRISYSGNVHKQYHGHMAKERFENEVRVLKHLEEQGCDFVPKLLSFNEKELSIETSNCGNLVSKLTAERTQSIFEELEKFDVRHGDPFMRNITYDARSGRFCIIDFEFATIISQNIGLTQKDTEKK